MQVKCAPYLKLKPLTLDDIQTLIYHFQACKLFCCSTIVVYLFSMETDLLLILKMKVFNHTDFPFRKSLALDDTYNL
jgi:hypothetical protein